jgi:5-methylcytosine-specific restriction endonuclease McrA
MSSLNRLVLCINATCEPVNIVTARRAIVMVCKGVAVVEEVSEHLVRTGRIGIPVPNVIRLVRYRRVPRQNRSVSRKGILLRDGFACQYCQSKLPAGGLTLDHVVPRSRGGLNTWENLVACCSGCNNRKSNRTPREAGMALVRQPRQISIHAKHKLLRGEERAWDRYLFA